MTDILSAIANDEFMCGGERLSLDEEKFEALDRFLEKVKTSEGKVPFDDEVLEEMQLSFLERCDELLLKMTINDLTKQELTKIHDPELRENLVAHLESVPADFEKREDYTSLSLLIESSLEVLEQIEDVSESWLLVALLDIRRLKTLYRGLEALNKNQNDEQIEAMRALFCDLMTESPLLTPQSCLYFHLVVEHLNEKGITLLLKRFLQAQLEYGQYLQQQYLRLNPEFVKRISRRLRREATIMAKQCTK